MNVLYGVLVSVIGVKMNLNQVGKIFQFKEHEWKQLPSTLTLNYRDLQIKVYIVQLPDLKGKVTRVTCDGPLFHYDRSEENE